MEEVDVDEVPAFARPPSELELEEDESLLDEFLLDESFEDSFEDSFEVSFDDDESDESLEEPDSRSLRRPLALAPWSFL